METQELFELIVEEIDSDKELSYETKLDEIDEWDSLSLMAVIAIAKKKKNKELSINDFEQCETLQDVINIIEN